MITQVLHCPYCYETDTVRHGKSPEGKQRYRCRQCLEGRGRTFLLDYAYAGQSPAIKQQIVDMAMNASGIGSVAKTGFSHFCLEWCLDISKSYSDQKSHFLIFATEPGALGSQTVPPPVD
jgi:InsA N-terminal domain/InsA C-terminal domain